MQSNNIESHILYLVVFTLHYMMNVTGDSKLSKLVKIRLGKQIILLTNIHKYVCMPVAGYL